MALDPRFIVAPSLQQSFVDVVTGLPLSDGYVFFRRDIARNELKPVYILSGSPPNYSYVPAPTLPNGAVGLSGVGTFPFTVYYFPFDADGNDDLYFIEWYNAQGVFQRSVEGWPNFSGDAEISDETEINLISNGKFLLHRNLPNEGMITQDSTPIAYGGWYFNRDVIGQSDDRVLFRRLSSFDTNPIDNPRYALNVIAGVPGTGNFKDIAYRWSNVNRFSIPPNPYTIVFSAASNGGDVSATLTLVKNFGTGGSPSERAPISGANFVIGSGFTDYRFSFNVGNNDGKIIGPDDDDYLEIAITLSPSISYNIELTDVVFLEGEKPSQSFPVTTNRQDISSALGGGIAIPDYDGLDIGLAPTLTTTGLAFQGGSVPVGVCLPYVGIDAPPNYLLTDGASYVYNDISPEGIPYKRLGDVLWDEQFSIPRWGTGKNYSQAFLTIEGNLMIMNNSIGLVPASQDVSTGYAITSVTDGGIDTFMQAAMWENIPGTVFGLVRGKFTGQVPTWSISLLEIINNPSTFAIHEIIGVAGNLIPPGFVLSTFAKSNLGVDTQFDIWYQVDGLPVVEPPGLVNPIRIGVESSDSAITITQKNMIGISNRAQTLIKFNGTTLNPGDYFTFSSATGGVSQNYHVYYIIDNIGSDPAPSNSIPIAVNIASFDPDVIKLSKTRDAINRLRYAVPNLYGAFIRGWGGPDPQPGDSADPETVRRFNFDVPFRAGNQIGNSQLDELVGHVHSVNNFDIERTPGGDFEFREVAATTTNTGIYGSFETRPMNQSLNFIILY